jgi:hypothetical protein
MLRHKLFQYTFRYDQYWRRGRGKGKGGRGGLGGGLQNQPGFEGSIEFLPSKCGGPALLQKTKMAKRRGKITVGLFPAAANPMHVIRVDLIIPSSQTGKLRFPGLISLAEGAVPVCFSCK